MVAIIHAYSRRNAGDGLLVDLSLERLRRAGVRVEDCQVFALDTASFSDLPHVHQIGVPGRRPSTAMIPAGAQLAAALLDGATRCRVRLGGLAEVLGQADAIVAVGGGYLRTGDLVSSLGTLLNHVPQLATAARSWAPTIYLPQSIGPLRGPVGSLVARLLRRIDLVCVRDDRSGEELRARVEAVRYPDLAVLQLAERLDSGTWSARDGARVVLVGRELTNGRGYEERLLALSDRLDEVAWAVQAEGLGTKSDLSLYERLGIRSDGRLVDLLAGREPGVVVSTRLHGAVQALLAGVPAIHLGYERKSWGAYQDLGLSPYVHDARRFDPAAVEAQARALLAEPSEFWARIEQRRRVLLEASERLTGALRERLVAAG
ncbi:MAG: polysaccharide pyruvyl transferase family protein [Actinomycetota bacterium]|nr:polysaccharide pyruvyl transferase family protein [Actinomycetota bacterium]